MAGLHGLLEEDKINALYENGEGAYRSAHVYVPLKLSTSCETGHAVQAGDKDMEVRRSPHFSSLCPMAPFMFPVKEQRVLACQSSYLPCFFFPLIIDKYFSLSMFLSKVGN